MHNVRSAIKKGSAIRGRINLNDVVKAVTHMVHLDAAAHFCKVEMSLARNLPAIEGDPSQIQQVLINLVRNAFDAMCDTPPSDRKVEIATNYNGDGTICVAVRDYGSGIPEPTLERLSSNSSPRKRKVLEWVLPSCARSSKHMGEALQPKTPMEAARVSVFVCRLRRGCHNDDSNCNGVRDR